ncbi:MAG: flagellar biosynthetic protein FliP [Nitrospirae bacterium]|nr:MAG: flagellar biosynthetic protein FliP [Nitrospirota bacterium]
MSKEADKRKIKRGIICAGFLTLLLIPSVSLGFDLNEIDSPLMDLFIILTLLTFIPAILVMFTSFTRIVVVLGFMRQAIGGQQIPPNPVVIGLSLFLTFFVMSPVIDRVQNDAVTPYLDKKINLGEALKKAEPPLREFMLKQTRQKDLKLFLSITKTNKVKSPEDIPFRALVPAFAISELRTAFEIGFMIYLPFLIIDMVVSSVLLSLGMMMLPPVIISLPFKLLLFVLVDGWNLTIGSLVRSFG